MGLTTHKIQLLYDNDFPDLFKDNKKLWTDMAQSAYEYTSKFVERAHQHVRRDDLVPPLVAALQVNETLRNFISASPRLSQKYWYEYFADLIIDELWDELTKEETEEEATQ